MSGTISGSSSVGITLSTNPTTITGTIDTSAIAVYGAAATDWTLDNQGFVASMHGDGVSLAGIGFIANQAGATITGAYEGVGIAGLGTVTNAGTIEGTASYAQGIFLRSGGLVTNAAGGLISANSGIEALGSSTILNEGRIIGNGSYSDGILLSFGQIDNAAGGTIIAAYAVQLEGSGTVINAGEIESSTTGGAAILFGSSAGSTLIIDPGSTIIGSVDGFSAGDSIDFVSLTASGETLSGGILTLTNGGVTVATLALGGNLNSGEIVLTSDGSSGTNVTLGSQVITGSYAAGITLTAIDTSIASAARITNSGNGVYGSSAQAWTLDNAGSVVSTSSYGTGVLLRSSALISNAAGGLIEGATGVRLGAGTLMNAGTIGSSMAGGDAVQFAATTNNVNLVLDAGSTLIGAVAGFEIGDTIDFAGLTATGETFANAVLTLTNGANEVATLALSGTFTSGEFGLAADRAGGTQVVIGSGETISGAYTTGLTLSALYTSIAPGGQISSSLTALYAPNGRNWTVANAGTVTSSSDNGAVLNAGTLHNSGMIAGYFQGLSLDNATLLNAGMIAGTGVSFGAGISEFGDAAFISNASTGTIAAPKYGVELAGGTLHNAGSIGASGNSGVGVYLSGGSATNAVGGSITAVTGIRMSGGTVGNAGGITATGGASYYTFRDVGLSISGGSFTNFSGGVIGGPTAVTITGGVLLNEGSITGLVGGYRPGLYGGRYPSNSQGIVMTGGMATNAAAGVVSGYTGLLLQGGTFVDAGTVASTSTTSVTTAVQFGTSAADLVLDQGSRLIGGIASFVSGDVIDFAKQTISSKTFANGVLTLENAGVVISTLSLAGNFNTADFGLASDNAGGTNVTLGAEVVTGSYSVGITLTSIDTTIAQSGIINSGSGDAVYGSSRLHWTLDNQGTLQNTLAGYNEAVGIKSSAYVANAKGALITANFIGLLLGGYTTGVDTVVNGGTISASGTYANAEALSTGQLGVIINQSGGLIQGKTALGLNGGTVVNAGTIETTQSGGTAIVLNGSADSVLFVEPGSSINGAITRFVGGDTIDLVGQTATSVIFANNTLTLENAGVVLDTFSLTGDFNTGEFGLASDGVGGTDVTLGSETLSGSYTHGITLSALITTIATGASIYVAATQPNGAPLYGVLPAERADQILYNFGTINDLFSYRAGADLASNDTIINEVGGSISGAVGVKLYGASYYDQAASLDNSGTIVGTRSGGYGADISYGVLTNGSLGLISGDTGVLQYDAMVSNSGRIIGHGTSGDGVIFFGYNGSVTNSESGYIMGATGVGALDYATLDNAGTIASSNGTAGTAVAFGSLGSELVVDPGAMFIGSITTGSTTDTLLEFASGGTAGTLNGIGGTITGFSTISFATGAAWSIGGKSAGLAAGQTIAGFAIGDTIDLTDFVASSETYVAGTGLILNGSSSVTLDITGNFATANFSNTSDGASGTLIEEVTCFAKGTHIATADGEVAVEALKIGDRVKTLHAGLQPVKWIGTRSYAAPFANHAKVLPVRLKAGAIADGIPARDLLVSPGHAICIEDALIHAARLVNGVSITQAQTVHSITYFHIELENHEVIFAENCPAETFVGEYFRQTFHNAADYARLYPGQAAPEHICLPQLTSGFQLAAIQRRLRARAGLLEAEADGPLRGYVDHLCPTRVRGWAQSLNDPESPVFIDIFVEASRIGRVLANIHRPDLQAAGLGSGHHGFEFPLPAGATGRITARRSSDGLVLDFAEGAVALAA